MRGILLALGVLMSPTTLAHWMDELTPLQTPHEHSVSEVPAVTVAIVYEKDCAYCVKQMREAEKYSASVSIIAVGTGAPASTLKRFAERATELPLYLANEPFLEAIQFTNVTPFTVVIDAQGDIIWKGQGYLGPAKTQALFKAIAALSLE